MQEITSNPLYGILFIAAVIFVTVLVVTRINQNKIVNIDTVYPREKFVANAFKSIATTIAKSEFKEFGKPTHTKKGEPRADFTKAINKKKAELIKRCCSSGESFDPEFKQYVKTTFGEIRRFQMIYVINGYIEYRHDVNNRNFKSFLNNNASLSPEEFFEVKNKQSGDHVGVYVIYNDTKDMYYVGQAKRLFFRVNQQFTGHGNGDVYADYKYGDKFSIRIIKLVDSGYSDVDKLEKDLIDRYNAFNSGYNRTKGNR